MDKVETFNGLLDYWGEKTPEKEVIFDGLRRMSYGELNRETQHLAAALSFLGIEKGDRVLAILPNWHEFITIFFAVAKIGAILVPCNMSLSNRELKDRFDLTRPKLTFVSSHDQLMWLETNEELTKFITVRFEKNHYFMYSEVLAFGNKHINPTVMTDSYLDYQEDVIALIFTSGTTGIPKGVGLTGYSLIKTAVSIGQRLTCTQHDVFLVPLPCTHLFGIVTGIIAPIYFGARIVIMEKYNSQEALRLIEKEQITVHHGVPTMFVRELGEYKYFPVNVSSLRTGIVAGSVCSEEIMKKVNTNFKFDLMVAYGLTEFVGVSMTSLDDSLEHRFKTVGRPYEGIQIKVVHESGRIAETGEIGELYCKGYGVMKGYYKMPCKTKEVLDEEGWLRTGDLGSVDELGYIRITARKKEVINRGGYKVYPREVENVYYDHPDILEVCVIGAPHGELGEQTIAYVQLKQDSGGTPELLREYAKDRIAKYKIPDRVVLLDNMPKLGNGKIDKKFINTLLYPK
ncbi:MAG: AMP-binding protein [Gracilibacter sp. BRH_c7a]|nr:MAG: AMP-binding protein [Gracilibacter sp. BRH_c7a]